MNRHVNMMIRALLVLTVTAGTATAQADDATQPRLITVTGSADVHVPPDEVILTLGVETSDMSLGVAKGQNDDSVKAIIETAGLE